MWAALLGTAFASKATTAGVGLAVLLAGVGTAEVTGIGPAVRESLNITQGASDNAGEQSVEAQDNGLGAENAAEQGAEVSASEDTPGNLVTNIRPDGSFSLRGILTADGVETSSGEVLFDLSEAELQLPGQGNPNADALTLDAYEGYLVLVTGSCDVPDGEELDMAEDCTVDRVTVLGRAGQGQPEGAGQPDVLPGNAPEGAGQPENPGQPGVLPNGGGQPDDTPPVNAQGGNPNSD